MRSLKIGILARETGASIPTIRYYESIGLLPTARREAGGQRVFNDGDIGHLTFIRRCRTLGFSVDDIRLLLGLTGNRDRSCDEAREIATTHLATIRTRIAELRELEAIVGSFADRCAAMCAGGAGPDCAPLIELSRPA